MPVNSIEAINPSVQGSGGGGPAFVGWLTIGHCTSEPPSREQFNSRCLFLRKWWSLCPNLCPCYLQGRGLSSMISHDRRYGLICIIMSAAVSGFCDLSLTQRECRYASGAAQGKGCQHARLCSVLLSASSSEGQTPVKGAQGGTRSEALP